MFSMLTASHHRFIVSLTLLNRVFSASNSSNLLECRLQDLNIIFFLDLQVTSSIVHRILLLI